MGPIPAQARGVLVRRHALAVAEQAEVLSATEVAPRVQRKPDILRVHADLRGKRQRLTICQVHLRHGLVTRIASCTGEARHSGLQAPASNLPKSCAMQRCPTGVAPGSLLWLPWTPSCPWQVTECTHGWLNVLEHHAHELLNVMHIHLRRYGSRTGLELTTVFQPNLYITAQGAKCAFRLACSNASQELDS